MIIFMVNLQLQSIGCQNFPFLNHSEQNFFDQ